MLRPVCLLCLQYKEYCLGIWRMSLCLNISVTYTNSSHSICSYSIFTGHAKYTILILRLYSRLLLSIQPYDHKKQSVQIYVRIDCAVILHYSRLDEVCAITLLCYSMYCKWADVNTTSLPPWNSNIIVFCLCHPSFISS